MTAVLGVHVKLSESVKVTIFQSIENIMFSLQISMFFEVSVRHVLNEHWQQHMHKSFSWYHLQTRWAVQVQAIKLRKSCTTKLFVPLGALPNCLNRQNLIPKKFSVIPKW